MDIKMPDGCILSTENKETADSYINKMGGVVVTSSAQEKKVKKSATKVASSSEAE